MRYDEIITDAESLSSEIYDGNTRIIDVRRENEYKKNHIVNSVNLPLSDLLYDDTPDRVIKLIEKCGIGNDTNVIIYDDTFGALASRLAWNLQYIGHNNVSLLDITYSKWLSLDYDVNNKLSTFDTEHHSLHIDQNIISTTDYVEKNLNNDNIIILDNRERLNFLEQHIPNSINIPYKTLSTPNKILKPKDELTRLLKNRNISNNEIITYCGSVGTLSGLAYYALKSIDINDVKLYVRSFKEWKKLNKNIAKQENANYWDLSAE